MMNEHYINAVRLLLAVAPAVFRDSTFALKGGTAINLFVRDMPRLSVDLDLVYVDHTANRDVALAAVSQSLESIRSELVDLGFRCSVGATSEGSEVKLFVERNKTRIKIEVNYVFRGTVLKVENFPLVASAQDTICARSETIGDLVKDPIMLC